MLHPFGGGGIDLAPRRHRPGERNLVDARIGDQRRAHGACALNDVVKTRGQARLVQDLGHFQRAKRRCLGRFEDHRIAQRQRRRAFPASDLGGVIPCTDPDAQAQRLAAGIDPILSQRDVFARDAAREAAEILERIRARSGVDAKRLGQGFARVATLQDRQFAVAVADHVGGAAQDAAALGAGHRGPCALRGARAGDRCFDDGRRRLVHLRDLFAGVRIDDINHRAARVLDIGTIHEMAGFRLGRDAFDHLFVS